MCIRDSHIPAVLRDFGDESHLLGAPGGDPLGGAHQHHPRELPGGHARRHQHRLVRADHAVGGVRVEELRGRVGDEEVALREQIEGPAAGHAVHGGDDRFPQVVGLGPDAQERIVLHVGRVRLRHHGVPVDPRAEGPRPGAGEHEGTHGVVEPERPPGVAEFACRPQVEGIEPVGPVKGDDGDATVLVDGDVQAHGRSRTHCGSPSGPNTTCTRAPMRTRSGSTASSGSPARVTRLPTIRMRGASTSSTSTTLYGASAA